MGTRACQSLAFSSPCDTVGNLENGRLEVHSQKCLAFLLTTGIAQIIATSTGFYYIVTGVNKLYVPPHPSPVSKSACMHRV